MESGANSSEDLELTESIGYWQTQKGVKGIALKRFGFATGKESLTKENLLENEQATPMKPGGRAVWLEGNFGAFEERIQRNLGGQIQRRQRFLQFSYLKRWQRI